MPYEFQDFVDAEANDPGYRIFQVPVPTTEQVEAVKAQLGQKRLEKFRQSVSSSVAIKGVGRSAESDALLGDGLDFEQNRYLTWLLQRPYGKEKVTAAGVIAFVHNPRQLYRCRVGTENVHIYKPLDTSLGAHNGFFKIVEGSHRMTIEEMMATPAVEVCLQPGQILIMDGEVVVEYPMAGGSVGLLECIKKGPPRVQLHRMALSFVL